MEDALFMSIEAGQTLAHYRLVEKIGEGGMGVVWKAIDTRLDRLVALKFLADDRGCDRGRLEREARTVAALNHPNIVTIHAVEEIDGNRVLVMELVEGKSLDRLIPETGLSLGTFYNMACLLLGAVAAAHDRGILHGDLKPANILWSSLRVQRRYRRVEHDLPRGPDPGNGALHVAGAVAQ